jgi:hypothetical protein
MYERIGLRTIAAALALAVAGVACDDSASSETGADVAELRVVAADDGAGHYRYDVPERVDAGPTRLTLVNEGTEEHHAQLFELNDGATVADVAAALATGDPAAALEFGSFEGGTALVAAGRTSAADAVVDFDAATYVLICFVPGPGGEPHLAHGMLQPFEVVETNDRPAMPRADTRVALFDYGFEIPDSVRRDALLQVVNEGTVEPHEMEIARIDAGATADDVRAALAAGTPPPVTMVGGVQALMPGASQAVQLDLEPGAYVAFCSIPSPFDQTPHHAKGMFQEVTVT